MSRGLLILVLQRQISDAANHLCGLMRLECIEQFELAEVINREKISLHLSNFI